MIKDILEKLIAKEDLSAEEAYLVMEKIMRGELKDSQVAAYLVALRSKGETVEEILGSCRAIRQHCIRISVSRLPVVDTCGTGGDAKGTFNISTVSAFVAAGTEITVAKHGNRAVSGQCGSADLCEALGINVDLSATEVELCLNEIGVGFLYAPALHPAMAHAVPARKALGLRTIFNILGPLNNPAGASRQLLGVYEEPLTEKMAAVLDALGAEHALVVAGEDGLDEITLTAQTKITEVQKGKIKSYIIAPEDFGFRRAPSASLLGGDKEKSARLCLSVLQGEKGPPRDVVLLNAGAAIYAAGAAESIKEGIEMAKISIDSGAAYEKLRSLVQFTRRGEVSAAGGGGISSA